MVAERTRWALLAWAIALGAGCGSLDSSASSGAPGAPFPGGSLGGAGLGNSGQTPGQDDSDAGVPLPPEKELEQSFRAPVATGKVLWSANPESGRVALIDAKSLAVRMTNAGFGPTYLAAVPSKKGTDSAIVLNVGSHD